MSLEPEAHHWLPAYGFQQPQDLQEALERNMELFSTDGQGGGVGGSQYLLLETIVEETSDDLRSESSCSGPAGWPDSDSDTASVIHVCSIGVAVKSSEWSGSERELAVPCKRRRHNSDPGVRDDEDDHGDAEVRDVEVVVSRSSSLLQFENLERHCEDVFRTSATNEPFPASPSRTSNFSFDSLETSRWKFCGSQDSLDEEGTSGSSADSTSDVTSSDDDITRWSRSDNSSFRSSGIRSCRSYDSLVTTQSQSNSILSGELSQSLNNTSLPPEETEPPPMPRGIYKTVECLTEAPPVACRTHADLQSEKPKEESKDSNAKRPERSAENLSEDSGFGEHMSSCNLTRGQADEYTTQRNDEGSWDSSDARAKYNRVNWQSAPDLADPAQCERDAPGLYGFGSKSLVINYVQRQEDEELEEVVPETKSLVTKMSRSSSRFSSVASTPNLYSATEEFLAGERKVSLRQSTVSLSRVKYDSASRLSATTGSSRGSRASNIQITTSFVNLSHSNSVKGVHFSPVVSEVSWQDTSSEEEEVTSSERSASTPPFEQLVERLRSSPPRRAPEQDTERRRIIEELHRLKLEKEKAPPRSHVGPAGRLAELASTSVSSEPSSMEERKKKHTGLGGFFHRFSFRRLSGRDKNKKEKKKTLVNSSTSTQNRVNVRERDEDFKIIPLHAPSEKLSESEKLIASEKLNASEKPKPPAATPEPAASPPPRKPAPSPAMAVNPRGLLETDIDSDTVAPASKKTRSLLNLDDGRNALKPCPVQREDSRESDSRAKSMEFLLDKENQAAVKPPENELQKVGGDRVMSEHQLRVQRSLQKLNVPEWYRNSQLPAQGFLLKRGSDAGLSGAGASHGGWPGLHNKTTSLSSLGSTQSAAPTPRSPNSHALSPSPTSAVFSRWSTSRLSGGSNATSTSTSPCGSTRSSFNYRQPYLGWRSQERLSRPRTPAERMAADLLAQKKQQESGQQPQNAPNLNEVRTSIKEVTSAIVHYVSGTKDSTDRLSPALNPRWDRDTSSSRSASPRGSTGRLCWLESSFVGSRPLDVPETPASTTTTSHDLYLELANHNAQPNGPRDSGRSRPSPTSTTMEDVLDSLLGLPPTSRSPSPSSPSLPLPSQPKQRRSCGDLHQAESASSEGEGELGRRRSEGYDPKLALAPRARRVSFEVEGNGLVRCRYSKCGKTSNVSDARRTFKTCHNCAHAYCSRECRRAHWEKHRKTCLHSRVGALCRRVLSAVKEDSETLHHISLLARRGFLARGRGAVKSFFSSPELAEKFVTSGLTEMGEPTYIRWADLLPNEMGPELYKELLRLCKSYNPDTRLVLYVAVCVVSEVPTSGAVKWERQLVSRCAKLRLSKPLIPPKQPAANITRDSDDPETLILTSLPGVSQGSQRARQISFTNIQRHLRQRGVSLRKQFPEVYQRLCAYVEGSSERFTPVTIYPKDSATGKSFMCIIMPDAEPEKLELLPTDSSRVQTVDISQESQ